MTDADRQKLIHLLASFDETGLVALSNKGLVRRATKDLESGGLRAEEMDDHVVVHGPGWKVTMPPEGPRKATDDTRATGITRQILMATMFLRQTWAAKPAPAVATESSPTDDLSTLEQLLDDADYVQLEKWAGKGVSREAFLVAQTPGQVEIERRGDLGVRLVAHQVEVRFFPAKTLPAALDAAIATAPRAARKRWVVAAVLHYRRHRGKSIGPRSQATLTEGSPRDRAELLAAAETFLRTLIAAGLSHPSERAIERLLTLSVSSVAQHLPRLSRLLRAAADELRLIVDRDAQADTERLLDLLALIDALIFALRTAGDAPPLHLCGRHRTDYEPVGDVTLTGIAAFPWRTSSGFEGVTVLFWDEAAQALRSWSHSRPTSTPDPRSFDLIYRTETPWSGGGAIESLARCRVVLRSAQVNPQGRLSASQSSRAEALDPTEPANVPFGALAIDDWRHLHDRVLTAFPLGLAESNPLDRYVVLRPATWGDRVFDELNQRFLWRIYDRAGNSLTLSLAWRDVNETAIEFLEQVKVERDKLHAVFARLDVGDGSLAVNPVALFSNGTPQGHHILNPAFDRDRIEIKQSTLLERLRKKYGRDQVATTIRAEEENDEENLSSANWTSFPSGLRKPLVGLNELLLRLSETGVRRDIDQQSAQRDMFITQLGAAGIDIFHDVNKPDARSDNLLRLRYAMLLIREVSVRELSSSIETV